MLRTPRFVRLPTKSLRLIAAAAEGHSNPEVAEKRVISPRTVETHRTTLLRKLRLQTQTDLVRFAIRKGLITA